MRETHASRGLPGRPTSVVARIDAPVTREVFLARAAGGILAGSSVIGLLAGCGTGGATSAGSALGGKPPARPTGTLRVAEPGTPTAIDDLVAGGGINTVSIHCSIYEGLVQHRRPGYTELVPALATSWTSSDDVREWTFKLRPDVLFHDGEPLTSEGVKKSFEYYLRPDAGPGAFFLGTVLEIDASDPLTITFKLRDGVADFLRNQTWVHITSPRTATGTTAQVRQNLQTRPVGTGPFRFASLTRGKSVTLEANPTYWGEGPYFERVEFIGIPDEAARTTALLARDVDVIQAVPPLAAKSLRDDRRFQVVEEVAWITKDITPKCDQGPCADVRVRQAIAYAVDRQALVDKIWLGEAVVSDAPLPPGVYGYSRPQTTYEYDPDRSRTLLREAGYKDKVPLTLVEIPEQQLAAPLAQAIAGQLNDAGFDVRVKVIDTATFFGNIGSPHPEHDLFIGEYGWLTGGPLQLYAYPVNTRYRGKDFADLLARLMAMPDGPQRLTLLAQIQELIVRRVMTHPMFTIKRVDVVPANVRAYEAPKTQIALFDKAYYVGRQ